MSGFELGYWNEVRAMPIEQNGVVGGIAIAAVSAAGGYLFSLWRNRLQPWINLLEFSDSQKHSDEVIVSEGLANATSRSWTVPTLLVGKCTLNEFCAAYQSAAIWLQIHRNTEAILTEGSDRLRAASSDQDKIQALRQILREMGASSFLAAAVRFCLTDPAL